MCYDESQVLYMGNKASPEKGQATARTEQVISESFLAETLGHLKTIPITEKHPSKTQQVGKQVLLSEEES